MKITELGEFGLIRRFSPPFLHHLPKRIVGIGDDCAIVPWEKQAALLVTTDMLVENVHFLRAKIPPQDLGYKALAVNLSDIAAMGGVPEYAFLSMAIPSGIEVQWLDEFFRGLRELAEKENVRLLGGDTTGAPVHLVINVAVSGIVHPDRAKFRSTARPSDVICVTGYVGDSGGGLRILLEDRALLDDEMYLVRQHHRPRPHLAEGAWLAAQEGVHAMMDISDGIDSDIRRIMESSECGADIHLERLPTSGPLQRSSEKYQWNLEELAAAGGEDYCLLATVKAKQFPRIAGQFERRFGRPLVDVGAITGREMGLRYFRQKKHVRLRGRGFDHFRGNPIVPQR